MMAQQDQVHVNYHFTIKSKCRIETISWPHDCEIIQETYNYVEFKKKNGLSNIHKDLNIYYRTFDMDEPKFYY